MKRILLLLGSFFCISAFAFAQTKVNVNSSEIITYKKAGTIRLQDAKPDFFPVVRHIEAPGPAIGLPKSEVQRIKENIKPTGKSLKKSGQTQLSPAQGINFEGNPFETGIPNDNDMAISDSGLIVSVINSNIHVYDTSGTLLKAMSLDAFSDTLKLPEGKYDPRVLYDPAEDRFVVVCLNGRDDSTSFIIVGFSQSNDPTLEWNVYSLPGDPLMDTSWSDYPILAFTDKELILTINALYNDSTWQKGFRQSFIWEMDKMDGYAGNSLKTKLHSGIKTSNGRTIRNLCPVQGGSHLTGDHVYFVSSRNFADQNDTIFLFFLKGYMEQSQQFTLYELTSSTKYGMPPTARQPKNHTFETNDARVLDAFIEDGKIQFVGNSVNFATGLAGIFHGLITDLGNPQLSLTLLGDDNLDYGYPSIAYAGISPGDDASVILVNHSSDTVYSGNSTIFYKDGDYSGLTRLKSGSSRVNIMSGPIERWGDYSGAQRKYNEPGHVWFAGSFGKRSANLITPEVNSTWISEVLNPYLFSGSVSERQSGSNGLKIYPSPVTSYRPVYVEFEAESSAYAEFNLYDINGRLVKKLLRDKVRPGKNLFSFMTDPLSPGIYVLRITAGESLIAAERITVQ